MHARSVRFLLILAIALSMSAFLCAADLTQGADSVTELYSPAFIGGGAFSTSTGNAQADAVNPAASGEEQRIVLDASYAALAGLGGESGLGHAVNFGGVMPTKYAVFAGSLRFLTSPFASYPIGTGVGIKASAAKELYQGFSAGIGLGAAFGSDWSLGVDLGVSHRVGTLSFMKNFRWAAVLGGLGKGWAPSAFSPTLGASFDLVDVESFRLGVSVDLGAPSFSNLTGRFGIDATAARFVTLASSVGFNLREASAGTAASAIPSFGLTLNFTLAGKKEGSSPSIFSDGELATSVAIKPLYGDVWAFGTGAVAVLGMVDRKPPVIIVDYPKPLWISPNNDGKADALEFPVSITDTRYVAEWSFIVENEKGEVVRVVRNKDRRPENEGFRDLMARVIDVKSGVEVPQSLRWDGIGDSGALAPDGRYLFRVEAKDDNGNAASSVKFEIYIDTTPPKVVLEQPEAGAARIFSPDGDGNKDTFEIKQTGSVEDSWKVVILDASGNPVRSFPVINAAPAALSWDGKDDAGKVVPDSVYRYEISAVDRAQNESRSSVDNIIVNTERPPVNVMIDEAYFSPNGDGIKDTLVFSPGVPVKEGFVSWTLEVQDRSGTKRRTFSGNNDVPAKVEFDGKAEDGKVVAEGGYQGAFVALYRNGYEAKAKSPLFTIDVTAPAVNVLRPGAETLRTFSPDGDGNKDTYTIAQSGSREDLWIAQITDAAEKIVRTTTWEGIEPAEFVWDGTDDSGRTVADGAYRYKISARDRAGNAATASSDGVIVDTSKPVVTVSVANAFYSPNGDGVADELIVGLTAQSSAAAETWKLELLSDSDKTATAPRRLIKGTGAPADRAAFGGIDDQGRPLAEG
ncbi:MAG: FlgD immunoglobulin-like domain containing protein, partial [Treponemataceae bacterium]